MRNPISELFKFKKRVKFSNMWININSYKDSNIIHTHPGCLISGVYYNSEDRISSYVGMTYEGLELGLVTGYKSQDIVPMIRYKRNNWFIAPGYESDGTYGIVIGLEFKLK